MQKIASLFIRDYEGNRQVYDKIVPGSEWVSAGEGAPTLKLDGTCCKVEGGVLYKRFDRKLSKGAARKLKKGNYIPQKDDYKPAPDGWSPAEPVPNQHTGHWPGWVPVNADAPADRWHAEAWECQQAHSPDGVEDGTYELVGPKVQGNPYNLEGHYLWKHGETPGNAPQTFPDESQVPRDFDGLKTFFERHHIEGIVWHHPDGRMVKIKRRDFGLEWPVQQEEAGLRRDG